MKTKIFYVFVVGLAGVFLTACGGSGGSASTPTPPAVVNVAVTCPNGLSVSGTGTDTTSANADASAKCPAVKMVTQAPATGTAVRPSEVGSIALSFDGNLDGASVSSLNVKATAGTTTVPVTVVTDGVRGLKVTFVTPLEYNTVYTVTYTGIKDSVGKMLTGSTTVATKNWWPAPNAFAATNRLTFANVKPADYLPATCTSKFDKCFKDFVADGKAWVGLSDANPSGTINAGRKIANVCFINGSLLRTVCLEFYQDNGNEVTGTQVNFDVGPIVWVENNTLGRLYKSGVSGVCFQLLWFEPGTNWSFQPKECPRE